MLLPLRQYSMSEISHYSEHKNPISGFHQIKNLYIIVLSLTHETHIFIQSF